MVALPTFLILRILNMLSAIKSGIGWSRGNTKKENLFTNWDRGSWFVMSGVCYTCHVLDLFISRFHCITVHLFAVYIY